MDFERPCRAYCEDGSFCECPGLDPNDPELDLTLKRCPECGHLLRYHFSPPSALSSDMGPAAPAPTPSTRSTIPAFTPDSAPLASTETSSNTIHAIAARHRAKAGPTARDEAKMGWRPIPNGRSKGKQAPQKPKASSSSTSSRSTSTSSTQVRILSTLLHR